MAAYVHRIVVIGAILLSAGCATHEVTIAESQVPVAVLRAFQGEYPGAVVKGYAKETKGLTVLYEIETDGRVAPHTVVYTPKGKLADTEVQIPPARLPAAVQDAVKTASPTGTITQAEFGQNRGKTVYEVLVSEGTRTIEYKFDFAGRLLKTEVK
jgi:putative PepSY-like beta-lactamase-inhibitor